MNTCQGCGTANPDQARFCYNCGTALASTRPQSFAAISPAPDISSRFLRPFNDDGEPIEFEEARVYNKGDVAADRFEIVREIGSGGMGAVFEVRDKQNKGERLALKVINPSLMAKQHIVDRFRTEGRLTRQLKHSNIITVYDVFEWRGRWHILMEFFPGKSLRVWLQEREAAGTRNVTPEEAASICLAMLAGLEVAHRKTVHRDLKPENIMLRGVPGAPDFELKLVDFGIAKEHSIDAATITGVAMGTTGYMAPEQQRDAGRTDARADLYAVGVVFYELLTGLLPIGSYDRVTELRPDLPAWVDRFVHRALRYDPDKRFGNTHDMAQALNDGLSGVLDQAIQLSDDIFADEQAPPSLWLKQRSFPAKQGRLHSAAWLPDGSAFVTSGDDGTIALWHARRMTRDETVKVSDKWLRSVSVSPDGRLLACGGGDKAVHVLKLEGLKPEITLDVHEKPVIGVEFSPDGSLLATSDADQNVMVWDPSVWEPVAEFTGAGVGGIAFSPDSCLLATGTLANEIVIWDMGTGEEFKRIGGHGGTVTSIRFSPDGRYLISTSDDSTLRVWDLPGFKRKLKIRDHSSIVTSSGFSADGLMLVSGGEDRLAVIRRSDDFEEIATLSGHREGVVGAVFSPDARALLTLGRDGLIVVFGFQGEGSPEDVAGGSGRQAATPANETSPSSLHDA